MQFYCNTLNTWNNKAFSMNRRYVIPVPIVDNPNLIPSCVDPGYKEWNISGIKVMNHLYEGGTLNHFINWRKSMAYLKSTDFCKSEFFKILYPSIRKIKEQSRLRSACWGEKKWAIFTVNCSPTTTFSSRQSWKQDLKIGITDHQWKTIMLNIKQICQNA